MLSPCLQESWLSNQDDSSHGGPDRIHHSNLHFAFQHVQLSQLLPACTLAGPAGKQANTFILNSLETGVAFDPVCNPTPGLHFMR